MIGVTGFGLFFTPFFYVMCRALPTLLSRRTSKARPDHSDPAALQPAE